MFLSHPPAPYQRFDVSVYRRACVTWRCFPATVSPTGARVLPSDGGPWQSTPVASPRAARRRPRGTSLRCRCAGPPRQANHRGKPQCEQYYKGTRETNRPCGEGNHPSRPKITVNFVPASGHPVENDRFTIKTHGQCTRLSMTHTHTHLVETQHAKVTMSLFRVGRLLGGDGGLSGSTSRCFAVSRRRSSSQAAASTLTRCCFSRSGWRRGRLWA